MFEATMTQTMTETESFLSTNQPADIMNEPARRVTGSAPTTVDEPTMFTSHSRRNDLVRDYPELNLVCDQLDIGWGQTLAEQFPEPGEILLELARSAEPPRFPPQPDWASSLVSELASDLKERHHRPLIRELQRLSILINGLNVEHQDEFLKPIERTFRKLRQNVNRHIRHDEVVVFPRCIDLEEALHGHQAWIEEDVTSAIRVMAEEHDAMANELAQSIALVRKVRAVQEDPDLEVILVGLEAMQSGLVEHAYGELEILLPAAIAAEEQLLARTHT